MMSSESLHRVDLTKVSNSELSDWIALRLLGCQAMPAQEWEDVLTEIAWRLGAPGLPNPRRAPDREPTP